MNHLVFDWVKEERERERGYERKGRVSYSEPILKVQGVSVEPGFGLLTEGSLLLRGEGLPLRVDPRELFSVVAEVPNQAAHLLTAEHRCPSTVEPHTHTHF